MLSSAHSSSKPVLLLLCGLLCDAAIWQLQRAALRDLADVQVVDFAGFDSITQMAAHVLAIAPPQFALAGHSMGGRVALEIVRQAPAPVLRLALLDTGIAPRRRTRRATGVGTTGARPGHACPGTALVATDVAPGSHRRCRTDGRLGGHGAAAKRAELRRADQRLAGAPRCDAAAGADCVPHVIGVGRQDAWSPPWRGIRTWRDRFPKRGWQFSRIAGTWRRSKRLLPSATRCAIGCRLRDGAPADSALSPGWC